VVAEITAAGFRGERFTASMTGGKGRISPDARHIDYAFFELR
jgi:hypothetical protein